MAVRGRKPKPRHLHVVNGTFRPDRHEDLADEPGSAENTLEPPKKLKKRPQQLWDQFIRTAGWLTEHDTAKAYMWCVLYADFEVSPDKFPAAMIAQLRALGSELGLDPGSRARLHTDGESTEKDPAEEFFKKPKPN